MKLIETPWWSLPLGEEWQVETDEDTIVIADEDGVGNLEFSVLELDGAVLGPQDLQELAQQIVPAGSDGTAVVCGPWRGLRFEYVDVDFCRDWVLSYQNRVLLISYTCDIEQRGMDAAAIDQMLAELRANSGL
jgi:hypothetical protein